MTRKISEILDTGLLPCPFCGELPKFERSFAGGPYILCDGCGAATMFAETETEASARWNTRLSKAIVDELAEALEKAERRFDLIARGLPREVADPLIGARECQEALLLARKQEAGHG